MSREKQEIEPLTIRFPPGMLDTVRAFAQANDRSLNGEIVRMVRESIEQRLKCPGCDGTGQIGGDRWGVPCPSCYGTGKIKPPTVREE